MKARGEHVKSFSHISSQQLASQIRQIPEKVSPLMESQLINEQMEKARSSVPRSSISLVIIAFVTKTREQ